MPPRAGVTGSLPSAVAERGMLQMKPASKLPFRIGSASGPAPGAYMNSLPGLPSPVR